MTRTKVASAQPPLEGYQGTKYCTRDGVSADRMDELRADVHRTKIQRDGCLPALSNVEAS